MASGGGYALSDKSFQDIPEIYVKAGFQGLWR